MKWRSFSDAIVTGLAPDGSLWVPEKFPSIKAALEPRLPMSVWASFMLKPFLEGDPLSIELEKICQAAFSFDAPLIQVKNGLEVLELFHGPTAAFKDFGARFLAECIVRLKPTRPRLVLVATSGDTGGAVASAFFGKPNIRVVILYPEGGVTPRQESQIAGWGGNIEAFRVAGVFDDCQRMVKEAFQDKELQARFNLTSANSINVGRLLPQAVYYARASVDYKRRHGLKPKFIIPSGNAGNAVAAFWARTMGFPIGEIVFATNANRAIGEFVNTGTIHFRTTITTLANAMDVGNPSNLERLKVLFPIWDATNAQTRAVSVSDTEIRETIEQAEKKWGFLPCPHTATAFFTHTKVGPGPWIAVATAHPAKFETVVEPLVGHAIEVPAVLQDICNRVPVSKAIAPSLQELKVILLQTLRACE